MTAGLTHTRRGTAGDGANGHEPADAASSFDTNLERILRISADLFARNGYHGTGITELCKAVGLGRGALYHYIGSKEAVLYRISKTEVDRMNALAEDLQRQNLDPEEHLRRLASGLLSNIAEHRSEWTVFFREYSALSGEWRDRVVSARERYEGRWRQVLDRGVREGTFAPMSGLLVKGLLGMFNYTYLWYEPGGRISPEELAGQFLDAILRGILVRR